MIELDICRISKKLDGLRTHAAACRGENVASTNCSPSTRRWTALGCASNAKHGPAGFECNNGKSACNAHISNAALATLFRNHMARNGAHASPNPIAGVLDRSGALKTVWRGSLNSGKNHEAQVP